MMNSSYGEVKKLEGRVTWSVPKFCHLPRQENYFLDSSRFELSGATWHLRLFPYYIGKDTVSQIWLLRLFSPVPEKNYCVTVGCADKNGKERKLYSQQGTNFINEIDFNGQKLFGCKFYIQRNILCDDYATIVPNTNLTVYCHVFAVGIVGKAEPRNTTQHTASDTETAKESLGVQKLKSDYKKLLESGAESDLLVVVSGRGFRVHKNILRARSPVFDAMFRHETKEKKSGKVVIDDLDPDSFRIFLEHLYTGNVEALSEENVYELYTAADKYDVQELKAEAVQYMQRHLSLESFCDVMSLALQYREHALMGRAIIFFKNNSLEILQTGAWQTFLRDNSTTANELLMEVLVLGGKK